MLKVDLEVHQLELHLQRKKVVETIAQRMLERVRSRTARGESAKGTPLPKPKDGGEPLKKTGSFLASFGYVLRTTKWDPKEFYAIIMPMGNREGWLQRKETRQAKMKAATAIGRAFAKLGGLSMKEIRAQEKAAKKAMKKTRSHVTQMALAKILSVAPKDLRSKKGGRRLYRVFEPRDSELSEATAIAQANLGAVLVTTGKTTRISSK